MKQTYKMSSRAKSRDHKRFLHALTLSRNDIFIIFLLFCFIAGMTGDAMAENQSEAVCDALTKYKKINTQSATYQAGVDVNGKAVVPADLNAPAPIFDNVTKVPLTVDLAQRLNSLQGRGIEMDANFGMLSIHPDGRVIFGEEDVTQDIKTLCGISHEVIKEEVKIEAPFVEELPAIEVSPKIIPDIIEGGEYRE